MNQIIDLLTEYNNKTELIVDFESATWNTVATHEVFTVTGLIAAKLVCLCTEDIDDGASGGTLEAGVESDTDAFIATTTGTDIDVDAIWLDATPADYYVVATIPELIVNDLDIGYEIKTGALTNGNILFILFWRPLEDGATVTIGAGGVLV